MIPETSPKPRRVRAARPSMVDVPRPLRALIVLGLLASAGIALMAFLHPFGGV